MVNKNRVLTRKEKEGTEIMDSPENTEEDSTVQNPWLKSCLEDWDDLEKEYPQLEVSTKNILKT